MVETFHISFPASTPKSCRLSDRRWAFDPCTQTSHKRSVRAVAENVAREVEEWPRARLRRERHETFSQCVECISCIEECFVSASRAVCWKADPRAVDEAVVAVRRLQAFPRIKAMQLGISHANSSADDVHVQRSRHETHSFGHRTDAECLMLFYENASALPHRNCFEPMLALLEHGSCCVTFNSFVHQLWRAALQSLPESMAFFRWPSLYARHSELYPEVREQMPEESLRGWVMFSQDWQCPERGDCPCTRIA